MKKLFVLLISLSLFSISCDNVSSKEKRETRKKARKEAKKEKATVEEDTYRLPPLPKATFEEIFKYGDYLDVIFYDLDFSMSQDNNTAMQSFLQNINIKRTPLIKPSCKAMGHATFLKQGNTIIEAEFYHSQGCYYFVFNYEDEKPMFSNSMSDTGINFFNNLKTNNFKATK